MRKHGGRGKGLSAKYLNVNPVGINDPSHPETLRVRRRPEPVVPKQQWSTEPLAGNHHLPGSRSGLRVLFDAIKNKHVLHGLTRSFIHTQFAVAAMQ